jgi:acyl-CoA synthetase (AMP-forming)/AMP-acid ligase II
VAVIDFFDRGWRIARDAVAYRTETRDWTYAEAGAQSCRIARALLDHGFGREVTGAVLAPNDPAAWICVLGLWRAGLAWVPLHPEQPPHETAALIGGFDCEVVFFHPELNATVAALQPQLPGVRLWICIDDAAGEVVEAAGLDPVGVNLTAWIAGASSAPFVADWDPGDVVVVSPTGGTTGSPKGVMNTQRSLITALTHLLLALPYEADHAIVNLAAAPMTHTAGVLTMACTARGGTVVVTRRARVAEVLDLIERQAVTELFLPPTVIYRLLDDPGLQRRDLRSVRHLLYGSAPMSTAKLRQAIDVFGRVLVEGYGQTEAPLLISWLSAAEHRDVPNRPDRLSSCGRPGPLVRVKIRGPDGADVPPGTPGEICVEGDLVMKGYYRDSAATAAVLVDGWLHTGDVGHVDPDGYLHITDRLRDLIISGGFNVFPSEVEQVIWSHPAVSDCAVVGVPHDDWGELVLAVVELHPDCEVTAEELRALCRDQLGAVRAPKVVEFVAELPRSPNGKVLKREVRSLFSASGATL